MTTLLSHDPRFEALIIGHARQERLWQGCRWAEGPAYFPAGRYLVWSDVPNDRLLRFDETDGLVSVFREPSNNANGNTRDRQGRLVTCKHLTRRVTRTEHDGTITVLADRTAEGLRLNSPNDVVVASDDAIWFTDPTYGIDTDYEGHRAPSETDGCHVYRIDPVDGTLRVVADDLAMPNGLAFSADEQQLYVVDTHHRHVRRFDVAADASLSGGAVVAECDAGTFDGLRLDDAGRLWVAAHDGLHCIDPDGTLLGKLRLPEVTSNLTFGGPQRNHLFITATTSVYALRVNFTGTRRPAAAGS